MSANTVRRSLIISLAVLGLLSGVACQKKSGKKMNLAFGVVPKKPEAGPETPAPETKPGVVVGGDKQAPAPNPDNRPTPPNPQPQPQPQPNPNPDSDGKPDPKPQPKPEPMPDPVGKRTLTGAKNKDGLYYTGSAQDTLLETLREEVLSGDQETVDRNKEIAASIETADIEIQDSETGARTAVISLKLKDAPVQGRTTTLRLQGPVKTNGLVSNLKLNRDQQKLFPSVKAELRCLDLDDICETAYVRIHGEKALANLLLRKTSSNLFVNFPKADITTYEIGVFSEFIWNSEYKRQVADRIDRIVYESFEVAAGKSGFRATIIGANREVMTFTGPLLAPENGIKVSAPVSRTIPSFIDDIVGNKGIRTNLSEMVAETRLIENKGEGTIQIRLRLKGSGPSEAEAFKFTFKRKTRPVRSLSLENWNNF